MHFESNRFSKLKRRPLYLHINRGFISKILMDLGYIFFSDIIFIPINYKLNILCNQNLRLQFKFEQKWSFLLLLSFSPGETQYYCVNYISRSLYCDSCRSQINSLGEGLSSISFTHPTPTTTLSQRAKGGVWEGISGHFHFFVDLFPFLFSQFCHPKDTPSSQWQMPSLPSPNGLRNEN